MAFPTPSWPTLPYMPERTYATASPIAIRIPNNFCAPFLGQIKYRYQNVDEKAHSKSRSQTEENAHKHRTTLREFQYKIRHNTAVACIYKAYTITYIH